MLHPLLAAKRSAATRLITLVDPSTYDTVRAGLGATQQRYLDATGFKPRAGAIAVLPEADGSLAGVLFGFAARGSADYDPFATGKLAAALPAGTYAFETAPDEAELAVLGYLLAAYRFTRYHAGEAPAARLVVPKGVDGKRVSIIADAVGFGRDLINTPTADLGPDALAAAALALAEEFGAKAREIAGKKLLKKNFPLIHAVGRAAAEEPRLVELTWGDEAHPTVTLVGKGVCFDTGGLNLKPDSAMLLMKKDMGGAAAALTAARMIMALGLKVRLRVVLAIVENAVSATSFRPGDVLMSRKGLTVEIGNTDAEGRLVLADALAYADEETPDLMIDYATLTGAARVALGPDLPPFYTDNEALAGEIAAAGSAVNDPAWRLPLWSNYTPMFESKIADLNNAGTGGMAGSITAALFLKRFVEQAKAYAHFDIYGWTLSTRNGLPTGGHPQAARLTVALLEARYGR